MVTILRLKTTGPKVDVHQAIMRWLQLKPENTRRQYLNTAKAWSLHLGVPLDDERAGARWVKARHPDALDYCNALAARKAQDERFKNISASTVRQRCVVLKSIYDELIAQGLAEANPFVRVISELKDQDRGHRRPHKRVPSELVAKLLNWEPRTEKEEQQLTIMALFFGAALRRGEVINIRIEDVEVTSAGTTVLKIPQTKAQRTQKVSLPDWTAKHVNEWIAKRLARGAAHRDRLLVRYDAKGRARPFTDSTIYRLFKRICRESGIGDWTPHCARVTAITQLLDLGFDHRSVQELSRHASVSMVERYDRKRLDADNSPSKKLQY